MTEFLQDCLHQAFLQRALLAVLLVSLSCGILGAYVIARRSSYMVGAVSHSLLGGIGLARWCQEVCGLFWFTPMAGAVLASLAATGALSLAARKGKGRSDAVLSGVWTCGVAIGLCFVASIPGYAEDLNGYLFGNLLMVTAEELWGMAALTLVILPLAYCYHFRFLALIFHEDSLALRGISPMGTELLLNILTGIAVVLLSQAVGVVLVLALMTLPAATAARFSRRMGSLMWLGGIFCLLSCLAGLTASYLWNWPAGAVIILVSALLYWMSGFFSSWRKGC